MTKYYLTAYEPRCPVSWTVSLRLLQQDLLEPFAQRVGRAAGFYPELLTEISEVTDARCYTLDDPNDLPINTQHIRVELHNPYASLPSERVGRRWQMAKD